MKTLEQIKEYKSESIDGRDLDRLVPFFTEQELKDHFDVTFKDEFKGKHKTIKLNRKNVMKELKSDLEFAFEKALNQRGLSSSMMFAVIMMWNWVLEDGLENWDEDNYAQYGLPLYKATANKYGLHNPIGKDVGDESVYASY